MPWAQLDDGLYDHPKLDMLGASRLAGVGLWTLAISWSNHYLTDGFIPADRVKRLGGTTALANKLVAVGLFEKEGNDYRIHDFLHYSLSREGIEKKRADARERMRNLRGSSPDVRANGAPTSQGSSASSPYPLPVPPSPRERSIDLSLSDGARESDFDDDLWARIIVLGEELIGTAYPFGGPYGGYGAMALEQATGVPWPTVEGIWRKVAAVYGRPDARQLLFDARDHLRPVGRARPTAVSNEEREKAETRRKLGIN